MNDADRNNIQAAIKDGEMFKAHVILIECQDHVPASKSRFMAWQEGPDGFAKRRAAFENAD